MITLRRNPGDRILELGGGAQPRVHPECQGGHDVNADVRMCTDQEGRQTVDFVCDFNQPLPVGDAEFDGVLSVYSLEHVSWRKVPQLVGEMYRVLKPGGKLVVIIPNTEAQMRHLLTIDEWCGQEGQLLFGDLDYPENSHKAAFKPAYAQKLFGEAGFVNITVTPFGEKDLDMVVEADKPADLWRQAAEGAFAAATAAAPQPPEAVPPLPQVVVEATDPPQAPPPPESPPVRHDTVQLQLNNSTLTTEQRAALFGKAYFNGGFYKPWCWDEPRFETVARHALARRPQSVLELGCGRGYALKRVEDAGVRCQGVDISKHCQMTRVASYVLQRDLCQPWGCDDGLYDLCLSVDVLDRIPEDLLPGVFAEMQRTCKRGLHAIHTKNPPDDPTRCTNHDLRWWKEHLPPGHEVVEYDDLCGGPLPPEVLSGDGKLKVNVGCAWSMFHHGWVNLDVNDMSQFAQQFQYKFERWDARNGLPYKTGAVDLVYAAHFLEHLTYEEGARFLKECRRVIKPGGAVRLIVPDARLLNSCYQHYPSLPGDITYPLNVGLDDFDEINDGCAAAPTAAGKLWALLHEGHAAAYDEETLPAALKEAGFVSCPSGFRRVGDAAPAEAQLQLLRETTDVLPSLSLFVWAAPLVSG